MKSPLRERPMFQHLKNRTQTHIFLCVLAYPLRAASEHRFLQAGIHTSWSSLRQQLSTHQVVTVVLPTTDGRVLKIRKATTPEPLHRQIYSTLRLSAEIMKPVKTWHTVESSDEKKRKFRTPDMLHRKAVRFLPSGGGCNRVMHLELSARKPCVGLVECLAKSLQNSRPMWRTERE